MAEERDKRTYKIGEVCRAADLQPYVLRYWETEFPALAPSKSGGGQRLYSKREIDIVMRIKQLLYSEGFTIAGAKKRLDAELDENQQLTASVDQPGEENRSSDSAAIHELLQATRQELRRIIEMLSGDHR